MKTHIYNYRIVKLLFARCPLLEGYLLSVFSETILRNANKRQYFTCELSFLYAI